LCAGQRHDNRRRPADELFSQDHRRRHTVVAKFNNLMFQSQGKYWFEIRLNGNPVIRYPIYLVKSRSTNYEQPTANCLPRALLSISVAIMLGADLFAQSQPFIHVVGKKETLWKISRKYNVEVKDLKKANKLRFPYFLSVGQKLVIPGMTSESSPEDAYRISTSCAGSPSTGRSTGCTLSSITARRSRGTRRVRQLPQVQEAHAARPGLPFCHRQRRGGKTGGSRSGTGGRPNGKVAYLQPIMNKVGIGVCLVGISSGASDQTTARVFVPSD